MITFRILLNRFLAFEQTTTIERLEATQASWIPMIRSLAARWKHVAVLADYDGVTRILWRQ